MRDLCQVVRRNLWDTPVPFYTRTSPLPKKALRVFCDSFCDFLALFLGNLPQNLRFENATIFLRLRFGKTLGPLQDRKHSNPQIGQTQIKNTQKIGFSLFSVYFCPILLVRPFSCSVGGQAFPKLRCFVHTRKPGKWLGRVLGKFRVLKGQDLEMDAAYIASRERGRCILVQKRWK